MAAPDLVAALTPVVEALEQLRVPYLIGGSVASSVYGIARATLDVDIVAHLAPRHVQPLVERLRDTYYISEEAIHEAIARRFSFNLIHLQTMIKVDLFIPQGQPFDEEEFRRIRMDTLTDDETARSFPFSSPEDVILHKLQWYRAGGESSERQWNDALGVLKVQAAALDLAYFAKWARTLGVADLLTHALREAGLEPP
ncbi:MAG TPA: hypothetical protein VF707_14835 [Ardenticatenaceae bacterium]|jgi:hypothetical protein